MDDIIFDFNQEKSHQLLRDRGISFYEIIPLLDEEHILDIVEHPNQAKYHGQKIYIINVNNYVYLVPFVRAGNKIFLKIIIPSRKATAHYLRDKGGSHDKKAR